MPSLTLFNRAWRFGSDDFVFPGIAGILLRGSWSIVLSTVFGVSYDDISRCNESKLVKIFFLAIIPLLVFEFLTEVCITFISMKGSIMNTRIRSPITKFIYIRLFLFIPELALTLAGSVWIFDPGVNCDTNIIWSIRVLIGFQWAVLIVVIIFIALFFDPLGQLNSKGERLLANTSAVQQALESHFQKACCCPGGTSNQQAFSEIAKSMAALFHDVDLVPSDIAAGLILLHSEQNRKNKEDGQTIREIIEERLVDKQDTETWERFNESVYFYHYAMGSYGWPLYVYMNLCCGFCRLCKVCKCGCAHLFRNITIEGDTCCNANTSAFISQSTSHQGVEHVLTCFENEVYQTPFCVSIDHNHKKVVICIRGTLSLKDVLTDLTGETENLELECDHESEDKCEGHRGMIKSANFIMEKLERDNILEPIFLRQPNYSLVIVGHSLGAGTGTILALLMRKKYETVKCFAISPPQVLNLKAAKYCEDFVTSVIVSNDIVARLSIYSMDLLKRDLIQTVSQCQLPKYQVFLGGCWQILCDCFCNCYSASDESFRPLLTEEHVFHGLQTEIPVQPISEFDKLFCPGKIFHLIERKSKSTFDVIHGDRKDFEKIAIGPNMIANHVPDNVKKAFDLVQSQTISSLPTTS